MGKFDYDAYRREWRKKYPDAELKQRLRTARNLLERVKRERPELYAEAFAEKKED